MQVVPLQIDKYNQAFIETAEGSLENDAYYAVNLFKGRFSIHTADVFNDEETKDYLTRVLVLGTLGVATDQTAWLLREHEDKIESDSSDIQEQLDAENWAQATHHAFQRKHYIVDRPIPKSVIKLSLQPRVTEVLIGYCHGLSDPQIATNMNIGKGTVDHYVRSLRRRLLVPERAAMVIVAHLARVPEIINDEEQAP